jgi:hypothetical protein
VSVQDGPAEMVAQKLDAKLRDHLQSRHTLFADALSGRGAVGSSGHSRPVLVILDRADDLPIMLQHSYIVRKSSVRCPRHGVSRFQRARLAHMRLVLVRLAVPISDTRPFGHATQRCQCPSCRWRRRTEENGVRCGRK